MKKLLFAAGLILALALVLLPWRWPRKESPPVADGIARNGMGAMQDFWPAERDALSPALLRRLGRETAEFRRWAGEYAAASGPERPALLERGRALAMAHRRRMSALISADPRRALEEALPVVLRQDLPPEINVLLEERVNARGFYGVLGVYSDAAGGEGIRRTFCTGDGPVYNAMVYGRRVRQRTTPDAMVHGVAVDGSLAIHESPLRPMEHGERMRADEPVFFNCPVSGQRAAMEQSAVTPGTPAVEMAGEVHVLCSGGHIHVLNEQAIAAEGSTGGPSKPTGSVPSSWTTGVKSVLYIRVSFPDQNAEPQSEKDANDMMKQVNDFFVENSHGKLHLLTTVTPLVTMPKPAAYYSANDSSNAGSVLSDARAAARAAGYDYSSYELEAVRYNGASGGFSGQAYVGSRGCWLKSNNAGVACHEFGHNFGLWHANYWSTGGESVIGSGSNSEYGNSFDTMGAASAGNNFFNAGHQNDINWMPGDNVTRVTGSGLYRIAQYDQGRLDPASRYLLAVKKDAQRDYWCEFRQRFSTNRWLMSGVQMNWSPWGDSSSAGTAYGSNGGAQLLDATPGSPDGKNDTPLVIGRTFSDASAGIHITPVAKGGTVPESIDVAVNVGAFPDNRPPSLVLEASAQSAALNQPVAFTATATDPDGDGLACAWDWGDRTFGPNSAAAVKTWSTEGIYTVRCEVSDMRGGTRSALVVVRVGAPAEFTLRGIVLTPAGEPVAGVRVHNGLSGAGYRGCHTDSEGHYAISGLTAGDYTVGTSISTHTFTAGFTNPVTVNEDVNGADFTAAPRTAVAISLPDDVCTEGGDDAVLRLARIAATNSGAITVRLFTGGSASLSDVDFTPVETYSLTTYEFTIPDGQPFVDVQITAADDSNAEGPEQMSFHLVDGSGYIPAGPETVTVTVNDNDTSLPVVSLEAIGNTAAEGGGGGVVRLSRTGAVDTALTMTLARSGTAAAGLDYTGINTAATIPAGATFVDLPLTAIQDAAAEGSETATFTLSSMASWIRSPQRFTASVLILDDDIPMVTITAADNAASETNGDPAVFLITRTGDLTDALAVDYALGGTAQHGTDYQPLSGSVTIPAGLANASLVITPVDDAIGEPAQTISVQLRSTPRYFTGAAFSATATLTDNDAPHVSVSVSDGACNENADSGKFKIYAHGSGSGNVSVHYSLAGTAVQGTDYATVSGVVAVPKGGYTEVAINPIQDTDAEDAESVVCTIEPDATYSLSLEKTVSLLITDDDQPMVSVSASARSYSESAGLARFYFSRNGATTDPLTVSFTLTGTATAGVDYTAPSGSVVIPAAASGAWLDVTLLDDAEAEGAEDLICMVTSVPGTYGVRTSPATVYLNDTETEGLPQASFGASSSNLDEGAGVVSIPVTLSAASAAEVRVDYALESGLAFNGVDYIASGGTLAFPPGTTSQSIELTLLDDAFVEPPESLTVRLVRAAAGRIGSPSGYTLTITDNDVLPRPVIGFAQAASSAGEGSGLPPSAVVFLSAPQAEPLSVMWTIAGGTATAEDVAAVSGTLTFLPGETAKPVPLEIIDDALLESPETIIISLSNPTAPATAAALVTHTLTVLDNDDTIVTITAPDGTASEEGVDPGQITVMRSSANLSLPITVPVTVSGTAAAGADYDAFPADIIIPAGEAAATLMLIPLDDSVLDPAETVIVSIAASPFYAVGNPSSATITIADNETGVAVTAPEAGAAEQGNAGTFTLTRTGPAAGELIVSLTVSGTAAPGADFLPLPDSITFADGQTTAAIAVTPVDDFAAEPDETVTLTIEPRAGYLISKASATVTIHDDDANAAPQVTIQSPAAASVFIPSGPGLLLDATVTDDGRPAPATPPTVQWSVVSGPGNVAFGNSDAEDTTAVFSSPGQYVLRLTAADAEFNSSARVSVFVLGDTLSGENVGTTSSLTGLAGGGSAWTLTGAGSGVTTTAADGFYFAHSLMSGDFTIVARVASISPANASVSARCGVMVRSALTPGAPHAFMAATPNRSSFVWRTGDAASGATSNTNQSPAVPRWVRLRRMGNSFTAAHSPDGVTWTTQGSAQTITMPDPVFAGLGATSASPTASVIATFDSFALTLAGNTGPFVDAGPSLTSGLSAVLAGFVSDDAPSPLLRWERVSGPADVGFPAGAAGMASFNAPGDYTLRLSANDGTVHTFDDTTVTIIGPFAEWIALHFGAFAHDPLIAGPRADPDNDGLENLAEYALGSNPGLPDSTAAPVSSRGGEVLRMTWRESTSATGVVIAPQWSGDMLLWESSALTIETLASGDGWTEKRATLDTASRPRACLRLHVVLP